MKSQRVRVEPRDGIVEAMCSQRPPSPGCSSRTNQPSCSPATLPLPCALPDADGWVECYGAESEAPASTAVAADGCSGASTMIPAGEPASCPVPVCRASGASECVAEPVADKS